MSTSHFEPSPEWQHALEATHCSNHLLLVVEDDRKIVGWCRLFALDCVKAPGDAELGIGLLPGYRGRRLGRTLADRALHWAAIHGIPRVVLTTRVGNTPALGLFETCGFAPIDQKGGGWLEMACYPASVGG